jgi:hypothetical protein
VAELANKPIVIKKAGSRTRKAINDAFVSKSLAPNILTEKQRPYKTFINHKYVPKKEV